MTYIIAKMQPFQKIQKIQVYTINELKQKRIKEIHRIIKDNSLIFIKRLYRSHASGAASQILDGS